MATTKPVRQKWKTQPRAVDEVEDLIDGDAAGMLWGRSGPVGEAGRSAAAVGVRFGEGYPFPGVRGSPQERSAVKRSAVIRARVTGLSPSKRNVEKPKAYEFVSLQQQPHVQNRLHDFLRSKSNPLQLPADEPVCQGRVFWRIRSGLRQLGYSQGSDPFSRMP